MNLINFISIWIVTVPIIIGTFFIKSLSKDSALIFILTFFATVPQVIHGLNLSKHLEVPSYNMYTIVEFFIMFLLFQKKLLNPFSIKLFYITLLTYVTVFIYLLTNFGLINRFLNEGVCLNNLVFTFWILLYILEQVNSENNKVDFRNSFTWHFTVWFLYAPCTLLVFSFWNYRSSGILILEKITILHNIFNTLLYIGFSFGFYLDYKKKVLFIRNEL